MASDGKAVGGMGGLEGRCVAGMRSGGVSCTTMRTGRVTVVLKEAEKRGGRQGGGGG